MENHIRDILKRIGEVIKSDKDSDIAKALGVAPNTLGNWKKRDKKYKNIGELYDFSKKWSINTDWLFAGVGDKFIASSVKNDYGFPPDAADEVGRLNKLMAERDQVITSLTKQLEVLNQVLISNSETINIAIKSNSDLKRENSELKEELARVKNF